MIKKNNLKTNFVLKNLFEAATTYEKAFGNREY